MSRADARRHILVVEDNPGDARLVREVFRDAAETAHADEAGFRTSEVVRLADAVAFLARESVDLVLLDLSLPDSEGIDTFVRVRDAAPEVPIVVFTRIDDMSVAMRAVREGAQDYLTKNDLAVDTLLRSVRYATERKQAERDRAALVREQVARAEAEAQRGRLDALTRELQVREKNLEEANRAKDDFLATVSHELRTPLNAMLGWARMLKGGKLSEEKRASAIAAIERNATAQAQLIDDILDVSRIISGKLRVELYPVSPNLVVEAAVDGVRPTAEAKGVTITTNVAPECRSILGDADRLQQILWNLLTNAIKFTPPGGSIETSVLELDEHVEIQVRDTGRGIATAFLPYVFERFRQADSAPSRAHGGLGLGLAIVRHLVELHGGTVDVASPGIGAGAVFTVRLPARTAPPMVAVAGVGTAAAPSDHPTASAEEPVSLAGLRVLVVDDEADARELTSLVLADAGADVVVAASVREAIASVRARRPDVLVSDLAMPGEDGFALIAELRAGAVDGASDVPAAALTAYARAEDARRALAAGFDVHAAKPVDPVRLILLVATLGGRGGSLPTAATAAAAADAPRAPDRDARS